MFVVFSSEFMLNLIVHMFLLYSHDDHPAHTTSQPRGHTYQGSSLHLEIRTPTKLEFRCMNLGE